MALELLLPEPEDTFRLGLLLGGQLRPGDTLALYGNLGAGKTLLTQGLARGLGVAEETAVVSPTFMLACEYEGRLPLFHLDVYRLDGDEFIESGLDEYFARNGVTVVEWADRIETDLPHPRLSLRLEIVPSDGRRAFLTAQGPGFEDVIDEIASIMEKQRN
jgi:tRNA threonylcarbamoyladenosine biosynthesis protein TsaE